MKLTNYIRDAFIERAMDDVPYVDYDQQIQGAVLKAFVDALPPLARRLWDDPATRGYLNLEYHYGYKWARGQAVPAMQSEQDQVELPKGVAGHVEELVALAKAQEEKLDSLRAKLRAVVYGCTTRKQLAEALPEFEKYLPGEHDKTANLPALANVATDFMQAGWPKTEAA